MPLHDSLLAKRKFERLLCRTPFLFHFQLPSIFFCNESDDSDDESQEEENLAEVEDEEPSSRTRFEAGRSRSGRRVTRYLLSGAPNEDIVQNHLT